MKLSPSVASANLLNIENELYRIGNDYETLHVDIEDGNFVPNITFGFKMLKQLREHSNKPFSVHLMVRRPEDYIDKLFEYQCECIFIHVESTMYIKKILQEIKNKGIKAGIAFNPATMIDGYRYLINEIDAILLMTSEPDTEENKFDECLNDKIQNCKNMFKKELWCDGGITEIKIKELMAFGVDCCVVGRTLFQNSNPKKLLSKYWGASCKDLKTEGGKD